MTKTKIILSAVVVGVTILAARIAVFEVPVVSLIERFPQIDRKIVRKAYREVLTDAFTGKYNGINTDNDAEWDKLFLAKVKKLTLK